MEIRKGEVRRLWERGLNCSRTHTNRPWTEQASEEENPSECTPSPHVIQSLSLLGKPVTFLEMQ